MDLQSTVTSIAITRYGTSGCRLQPIACRLRALAESFDDAPSYNCIYTVLKEEVFETASLDVLEQQANTALEEGFKNKRVTQVDVIRYLKGTAPSQVL